MPDTDEHVSETDFGDVENDENTPIVDDNDAHILRSSSLLALRTPLSHSRTSHDTALQDITDQFFHPPSPSPVRISKLKRAAPHTAEPPRRPKKPKSLAYPADPPNWLYSRSSSSLPPSSPFALPPSPAHVDRAHRTATARHEYHLGTPAKASDSDPFGFVAVERALKAQRVAPAPVPHKPISRISAVKSPPRSFVLPSAPSHAPAFPSFSQLDAPVPTNNEDIEGLYTDEPVAGPSHVHVPVAPLLMMNSDQSLVEFGLTRSLPAFSDPLRTPRKPKHRASPTPDADSDPDDEGTDIPSSPSPVKISVGAGTHRRPAARIPIPKLTRAQARAGGSNKPPAAQPSRTKRIKISYQHIPTPSSTPASVRPDQSSRQPTAPPTPVPPRRSTRQAAVGAKVKLKDTSTTSDGEDGRRMKLRSRSTKTSVQTKTKPTTRIKQPSSKSKAPTRTQKATATTTAKPRGRPKGKSSAKNAKGKDKTRPLESVLDLSDDTRERYEKERRERLEYFKRLEGYQIQKENVYVV